MRNAITDVPGVLIGSAHDARVASGATIVVLEESSIASVSIQGGAPASHDTAMLDPRMTVERVDAIALSGGSVYGLETAAGVKAWLAERGRGFPVGGIKVPIVPGAAMFDLLNGGDKAWGRRSALRRFWLCRGRPPRGWILRSARQARALAPPPPI